MNSMFLIILFLYCQVYLTITQSGACDGNTKQLDSSEKRKLTEEFKATAENKLTLSCQWQIKGTAGKTLIFTLDYITIGYCPQSSFIVFEGINSSKTIYTNGCQNISTGTSNVNKESKGGYAFIKFTSDYGSFPHAFKFSYISDVETSEPFNADDRSNVGVTIAIVLGIVFIGSLFIALTYCSVKMYNRCRNKDPEESELTSVTNLRSERMRERIMKDDFDTTPIAKTSSTPKPKLVREAYC